jgi:hypothetical protein
MMASILLPTIRPDLFRIRMREYARLNLPWPCEVVVVTDGPVFSVEDAHPMLAVNQFSQPRMGNIPATNLAFQMSQGRYVFATNDEVELDPDFLVALVAAGEAQGDGVLSAVQEPYCSNDYYGIYFATCPFALRDYLQRLNHGDYMFDPAYACFYGDPDLGIRTHMAGLPVKTVPAAKCTHHCVPQADGHVSNAVNYYHRDRHTFVTRWAHLGPPPIDPSLRQS